MSDMRWICSKRRSRSRRCFLTLPRNPCPPQQPQRPQQPQQALPLPSPSQPIFSNAHAGERFALAPRTRKIVRQNFQCVYESYEFDIQPHGLTPLPYNGPRPHVSYPLFSVVLCVLRFTVFRFCFHFFCWCLAKLAHSALTVQCSVCVCVDYTNWRQLSQANDVKSVVDDVASVGSQCSPHLPSWPACPSTTCSSSSSQKKEEKQQLRRASRFVVWNSSLPFSIFSFFFHLVSFTLNM